MAGQCSGKLFEIMKFVAIILISALVWFGGKAIYNRIWGSSSPGKVVAGAVGNNSIVSNSNNRDSGHRIFSAVYRGCSIFGKDQVFLTSAGEFQAGNLTSFGICRRVNRSGAVCQLPGNGGYNYVAFVESWGPAVSGSNARPYVSGSFQSGAVSLASGQAKFDSIIGYHGGVEAQNDFQSDNIKLAAAFQKHYEDMNPDINSGGSHSSKGTGASGSVAPSIQTPVRSGSSNAYAKTK